MNLNFFLSFLYVISLCIACQKVKDKVNKPVVITEKGNKSLIDTFITDESNIYGDWPDSVLAEFKIMDSLLLELDKTVVLSEKEEALQQEMMDSIYQADIAALEPVNLGAWEKKTTGNFKQRQLSFERVATLYEEDANYVKKLLTSKGIHSFDINFYLRAFKEEGLMELWAKDKRQKLYQQLATYPFYQGRSNLGPKKRQGDLQVPEGFYHIDYFNPESSYKVSLRVNYPNAVDQIRNAEELDIGGSICIHGHTISVGCLAITDNRIPTVYILAVEAMDKGQLQIPIHIFPMRLSDSNLEQLKANWKEQPDYIELWESMKPAYDYFELTKRLPRIQTTKDGLYEVHKP